MTTLHVSSIDLPTAPLGPVNPLPMLGALERVTDIAGDVPADLAARARTGTPPTLFPYLAQDDYDRELTPRPHRVAVLENGALRATVALDLGGRLLSLVDRRADRELLYVNSVVQPANLALRNAWISGGVEWNIGTRGHSPTTMDTLHAASVDGPDGTPMLRLWEFERVRGVVFQVDLWLPESAPVLLCSTRIVNLNDEPTPMYWWTNAAIVVAPGTRVLAPATRAFRTEYPNRLRVAAVPDDGHGDISYPERHDEAADFFFDVVPEQRPWIAAVGEDGYGVAHVSTPELRGRKLFVWGNGTGGRRWQEWLSHGRDEPYAEIQAGLAPTQFEHLSMPPRAEWSWTEAFGPLSVDAGRCHGAQWADAVAAVGAAIDELAPPAEFDDWHRAASATARRPPSSMLATGSGWGALERLRRHAVGTEWFDDAGVPFPDATLGPEQRPWQVLLDTGALPDAAAAEAPASYVIGDDWESRLAAAPMTWQTAYLRATMLHARGAVAVGRRGIRGIAPVGSERVGAAWSRRRGSGRAPRRCRRPRARGGDDGAPRRRARVRSGRPAPRRRAGRRRPRVDRRAAREREDAATPSRRGVRRRRCGAGRPSESGARRRAGRSRSPRGRAKRRPAVGPGLPGPAAPGSL